MSTRVFQSVINQLKDTVDRTIAVTDDSGVIVACSELVRIGERIPGAFDLFSSDDEIVKNGGNTYKLLGSFAKIENIIMVQGDDKEAAEICAVLAVSFASIKNLYGEKYDKSSFIKNIILDNILPSDIYIKAKELHFNAESSRAVFFVRFSEKGDVIPYDIMQNMFPDKNKDYVISIGEHDVVLVREVKTGIDRRNLKRYCQYVRMSRRVMDLIETRKITRKKTRRSRNRLQRIRKPIPPNASLNFVRSSGRLQSLGQNVA